MIELTLKKGAKRTHLKIYDDIDQLPVKRFTLANKYWMLHDSIGSSIEDFDKIHFNKITLIAGDKEKTLKELANFRILIYNIMNGINVQHLSFACLIHSINGIEVIDLSQDNLQKLLNKLSALGLTQDVLKKKLNTSTKQSTQN